MIYRCNLHYSLLVERLFRYNAHFIITLFLLGSHHEHCNEVAVYLHFPSAAIYPFSDSSPGIWPLSDWQSLTMAVLMSLAD